MTINPYYSLSALYLIPFAAFVATLFLALLFLVLFGSSRGLDKASRMESQSLLLFIVCLNIYNLLQMLIIKHNSDFAFLHIASKVQVTLLVWTLLSYVLYAGVISGDYFTKWHRIVRWSFFGYAVVLTVLVIFTNLIVQNEFVKITGASGKYINDVKYSDLFDAIYMPYVVLTVMLGVVRMLTAFAKMSPVLKRRFGFVIVGILAIILGGMSDVGQIVGVKWMVIFDPGISTGIAISTIMFSLYTVNRIMTMNRKLIENRARLKDLYQNVSILLSKFDEGSRNMRDRVNEIVNNSDKIVTSVSATSSSYSKLLDLANKGETSTEKSVEVVEKNIEVFQNIVEMMKQQNESIVPTENKINEMADVVHEISGNSTEMADSISTLAKKVDEGAKLVNQNLLSMNNVKQSIEEVSYIIDVINDISEQINILAMNASIEAAHAGEHGKGFAVVAQEISSVSYMTFNESESIRKNIWDIISEAQHGAEMVAQTNEIFRDFSSNIEKLFVYIIGVIDTSKKLNEKIDLLLADMSSLKSVTLQNSERSHEEFNVNTELMKKVKNLKSYIFQISGSILKEKERIEAISVSVTSVTGTLRENEQIAITLGAISEKLNELAQSGKSI